MTATVPNSTFDRKSSDDNSITASLDALDVMFERMSDHLLDAESFEALGGEFRRLHACLRAHHAAAYVEPDADQASAMPPEQAEELSRLRLEHFEFLGRLDRLVRCSDSLAERTLEDKEVFLLRGRELIASLRRHEAEEDRLFYLAVWRDTGGES